MSPTAQREKDNSKKPGDIQRLDTDYDPDPRPRVPENIAEEVPGTLCHTLSLIRELSKDIHIVMLISRGLEGRPKSRPMALPSHEFDGNVWLLTSRHSQKILQIQQDPLVQIIYPHPQSHYYLSLDGVASLVDEREQKKNFWAARYRTWFPHGVDDSNLVLLRIQIECGEYWIAQPRGLKSVFSRFNPPKNKLFKNINEHGAVNLISRA